MLIDQKISIVIPTYHSNYHIHLVLKELELFSKDVTFELVIVDDSTDDETFEELKRLIDTVSYRLKVIKLSKNYGQHTATAIGIQHAMHDIVVTMDDDLQHSPKEIIQLYNSFILTRSSLIYGVFKEKKHSLFRNYGSRLLGILLKNSNQHYRGISSFRMFSKQILLSFLPFSNKVIFLDEYLINQSPNFLTVDVTHHDRVHGKSNYSIFKLFKFAVKILIFNTPSLINNVLKLGLLGAVVSLSIGAYLMYKTNFASAELNYKFVLISILLLASLSFVLLGLMAIYLRKRWIKQDELESVCIDEIHENQI